MSLREILGQEQAVDLFQRAMRSGHLAHAYLLMGPEGVGKRSLALMVARALNCMKLRDDCCDGCSSCHLAMKGHHPDMLFLAPQRASRQIHIDQIHEVIQQASLKPYQGKWKVFIIDEAERLNIAAANCLLKTLEEPPSQTIFFLISSDWHSIRPTIASRCQGVRLQRLPLQVVQRLLEEKWGMEPKEAHALALRAEGQMTRAVGLMDSSTHEQCLETLLSLRKGKDPIQEAETLVASLKELRENLRKEISHEVEPQGEADQEVHERQEALLDSLYRKRVMDYLKEMLYWFRDLFVLKGCGDETMVFHQQDIDLLKEWSQEAAPAQLALSLTSLQEAKEHLERNIGEERTFMNLFFRLSEYLTFSKGL